MARPLVVYLTSGYLMLGAIIVALVIIYIFKNPEYVKGIEQYDYPKSLIIGFCFLGPFLCGMLGIGIFKGLNWSRITYLVFVILASCYWVYYLQFGKILIPAITAMILFTPKSNSFFNSINANDTNT